jgi:hypothetical protein
LRNHQLGVADDEQGRSDDREFELLKYGWQMRHVLVFQK